MQHNLDLNQIALNWRETDNKIKTNNFSSYTKSELNCKEIDRVLNYPFLN